MGFKYRADDKEGIYFLTSTIVNWIDLFTRRELQEVITDSLKFCQANKGLIIHAWCLMPSHLHLIASNGNPKSELPSTIRDFKKHTSKEVIRTINQINESRQKWLLNAFEYAGRFDKKIKDYKVWQQRHAGNHLLCRLSGSETQLPA